MDGGDGDGVMAAFLACEAHGMIVGQCFLCWEQERVRLEARIQALETTYARHRIEILSDAKDRGYLDHRDTCRKGTTSETCTCGIMTWLVKEPPR